MNRDANFSHKYFFMWLISKLSVIPFRFKHNILMENRLHYGKICILLYFFKLFNGSNFWLALRSGSKIFLTANIIHNWQCKECWLIIFYPSVGKYCFPKRDSSGKFFSSSEVRASAEIVRDESRFRNCTYNTSGK